MTVQTVEVLRVVARRDGFRRAGLVFGTVARDIPLAALSEAARVAIQSDPMLVAGEVVVQVQGEGHAVADPETPPAPSRKSTGKKK